ncbi:hypothetical protein CKAN_00993000 [Cinnamomum micranthum f. kanehirae]|uniref:Uncharacterized protein n=1 Tax=Cinnamomum micranthum f. kanehirae TaxID=337451 RepID=A0A443NRV6_9MAGN|nr:hypothetical protein CKAN_00993000 [Cinnamomum micranthum f. kanehirae]
MCMLTIQVRIPSAFYLEKLRVKGVKLYSDALKIQAAKITPFLVYEVFPNLISIETNKKHNQRERLVRGYRQHISSKIIIFPYHRKYKRGSCYLFQLDKNLQLNLE